MREKAKLKPRRIIRVKNIFDSVLENAKDIRGKHNTTGNEVDEIVCTIDDGNIVRFSRGYVGNEIKSWTITVGKDGIDLHGFDTFEEYMKSKGLHTGHVTVIEDDGTVWKYSTLAAKENVFELKYYKDTKPLVSLIEILETDEFKKAKAKSKLSLALGRDDDGKPVIADLAKMPHLLVGGSGYSDITVCLHSMIISLLQNAAPDELKLVLIDFKYAELLAYKDIPHLQVPVISHPHEAIGALDWAISEMEKRYSMFAKYIARDIDGFNKLCNSRDDLKKMHRIVIFINELTDLMFWNPEEAEKSICKLVQMARATGIHLVIGTQCPRVDVITPLIKANIPSRIALWVDHPMTSKVIIDRDGAEKLLGNGDMLFAPVGSGSPTRIQSCYINGAEVHKIVEQIKSQSEANYSVEIMREIEAKAATIDIIHKSTEEADGGTPDPLFNQAAECVIQADMASTTLLQKKLKLGYARVCRIMDQLEENGIVGPQEGYKPRRILITLDEWKARKQMQSNDENE